VATGGDGVFVEIRWVANPFRGPAFQEAWLPAAGAVLDYGATYWSFLRADEGRLDFLQHAIFPAKADFERYWYSERIAQARAEAAGLYQVPILPTFHTIVGSGVPMQSVSL
jgi:hypothetical protein